eukprot:TRINITY_DN2198_c1_g1_i1.p1 TRINITY_DN2198_c1_g1~~TRINITY_DN2198_c1_g1_i1.p1  ORF type:complete len:436 (-),score=128.60 TRINITY_DN2198_c1_g1_i1:49-1356(-)
MEVEQKPDQITEVKKEQLEPTTTTTEEKVTVQPEETTEVKKENQEQTTEVKTEQEKSYDLSSDVAKKLKKQLQFYFSDSNYINDKFLRSKAAENDGYIPISVFITFNRVKILTVDVGLITAVLKTCEELEVLNDKVKRKSKLPEVDTSLLRSIYAKGFPTDGSANIDTIMEKFASSGLQGSVLSVRLRYLPDKTFKGSGYIEFEKEEDAKKFIAQKTFVWDNTRTLQILTKEEHQSELKERNEKFKEKIKSKDGKNKKRQREDTEKTQSTTTETTTSTTTSNQPSTTTEEKGPIIIFSPGCIIEVKPIAEDFPLPLIKAHFAKFGKVAHVDTLTTPGAAIIRFADSESTKIAIQEITEKKVQIGEMVVEGRLYEGEEDQNYWNVKVIPRITEKAQKNRSPKTGGRGRGGKRGGKRGGRGGRGGKGQNKRKKVEQE